MLASPFELLSCSWPRPVVEEGGAWKSDPEWDAPVSPLRPQPTWRMVDGEPAWAIDWCALFGSGIAGAASTEMSGFHVVFRVRVMETGTLVFWADDGCVVRLGGRLVHEDRANHPLARGQVEVCAGDVLEVAQWQYHGDWMWCARSPTPLAESDEAVYAPYREAVHARVREGSGPPLKLFTDGRNPLRAVVAAYSVVLNGYAPSAIHLYGTHQWSPAAEQLFRDALPCAQVVDSDRLLAGLRTLEPRLVSLAKEVWYVMKTCAALLDGPAEFALVDDDLFVLDPVDDALDAFRTHDLVFIPDYDHAQDYYQAWGKALREAAPSPAGRFNAGLYWCRRVEDPRTLAKRMLRLRAHGCPPWLWDQGFIATSYAQRPLYPLPTQRYFYPFFEGLPGGMLGYDYAGNPCGFASIHFGGLAEKPDDAAMRCIGPQLLARRTAAVAEDPLALAG